jgi:hypothetical protein
VKTVVLGPRPAEVDELIRRRRRLGVDTFDEVWEGSYHVAPPAPPAHGYIDNELAALLAPVARSVGLVGARWPADRERARFGRECVGVPFARVHRRGVVGLYGRRWVKV